MPPTTIIGIDCATQPQKVGLALAHFHEGTLAIKEALTGTKGMDLVAHVADWLPDDQPALLAMDAPLGWPVPLAAALQDHQAGDSFGALGTHPDLLFQRETDRVIREYTNKRPLDVGADRIARTAHAALTFLAALRQQTQLTIPLAWNPGTLPETSAIEVYPAATLLTHGMSATGYKAKDAEEPRKDLVLALSSKMTIPTQFHEILAASDHPLDAVICTLAASDFLRGNVIKPEQPDIERIQREGWIWCATST